jgi:putative peptidoglycan lipid II flippase
VSGALSVTFIPVFNQRLASGNKKSAWELSSSMINFMAIVTLVTSVLIMIFAQPLVDHVVAPGKDEVARALAASMMRVIAINPFLFAIATVMASMQQAVGRYTFFALAPTMYNVGIIIGALWFTEGITLFGREVFEGGIMGVALGVAFGSMLQLVVSAIGLAGLGFDYRFKIYWQNKGFRKTLRLLPARSLDQGMDYLIGIVEMNIASRLADGVMRAYQQVSALHLMPVNLIGVAISTAAFPSMTEHLSAGKPEKFRAELQQIVRVIVWLALPVATITYFGRGYVISFIKNGGDPLMAGLLGALVVAILFRSIYHIAARSFYAQQDTKTPFYISIVSISINIALAIWLSLSLDMGAYGLAFAQSIVALIEVVILFAVIQRRLPGGLFDSTFVSALMRMTSAAGFMAIVCYLMVRLLQFQNSDLSLVQTIPKFAAITLVSFAFYVWVCRLMKLGEAGPVIEKVRQVLFGKLRL